MINTNGNPGPLFLVVNLCDSELEKTGHGEHSQWRTLRESRRPKYLHETRDEAEQEALRLGQSQGSSTRTFVVFEAIMWSRIRPLFDRVSDPVCLLDPIESPAIQIPEKPRKKTKVKAPHKAKP